MGAGLLIVLVFLVIVVALAVFVLAPSGLLASRRKRREDLAAAKSGQRPEHLLVGSEQNVVLAGVPGEDPAVPAQQQQRPPVS
jgi:hypothetical protein